jgi:hypothetical protein
LFTSKTNEFRTSIKQLRVDEMNLERGKKKEEKKERESMAIPQ